MEVFLTGCFLAFLLLRPLEEPLGYQMYLMGLKAVYDKILHSNLREVFFISVILLRSQNSATDL